MLQKKGRQNRKAVVPFIDLETYRSFLQFVTKQIGSKICKRGIKQKEIECKLANNLVKKSLSKNKSQPL